MLLKTPVGKWATLGFAATGLVLLTSGMLAYLNLRRVAEHEAQVVHTHEVLDALQDALGALTDAETGQRGYVVTGEAPYLEPYRAALVSIERHFARLNSLTADSPPQRERIVSFQNQAQARLATLQQIIDVFDREGHEAARDLLRQGAGKKQMDEARATVGEIERKETELLDRRRVVARQSYRVAILTLLITTLLGLASVATAYVLTAREVRRRRQAALELERINSQLEQRIAERTADLAALNVSLRRSNRELEQFASVASHDLQEPLRKIQAFGDRLQSKFGAALGEQGQDYVERMQASATRMRSLIDALLSYSRVTTKAQPFVDVDLNQIAQEVLSDLEGRLQQTGGRVELEPLPTLQGDPLQLRQLLQNLIGNGLKFYKAGETPRVRVSGQVAAGDNGATRHGPHCVITIEDDGIGFEAQYRERIFEVFQRLHGRQEYEGTGMGLAICRRIVERHGGSITAASGPDRGARFVVTLPLQPPGDITA